MSLQGVQRALPWLEMCLPADMAWSPTATRSTWTVFRVSTTPPMFHIPCQHSASPL